MPSSICCTNCRTKYSLLNREAGCSNCAMSFCKKCLNHRAIIPTLSMQPMIVCSNCYQKLEAAKIKSQDATITFTPLPESPKGSRRQWWGEGLPPPSFRSAYAQNPPAQAPAPSSTPDDELRQRMLKLREKEITENAENAKRAGEPPSMEEIEERLARLRGCDVEVIRNPRSWFHPAPGDEIGGSAAKTPAELMKIAEERARLEQKEERFENEQLEELEARRRRVFEKEEPAERNLRESVVSGGTEFSEATKEEMDEINSLLVDAEKRVAASKKQEENDEAELKNLMKLTRQKSLEALHMNEKIQNEIGGLWDRRNAKVLMCEGSDDEKSSLDEETFKRILREAETSEDVQRSENDVRPTTTTTTTSPESSPKKKGFFGKFFRRDSKH